MVGFGGLVGEARLGRRGVLIGGRFLSSPPRRGVPPWRRRRRPEGRRPGAGAAGAPHDHAGVVIADARPSYDAGVWGVGWGRELVSVHGELGV